MLCLLEPVENASRGLIASWAVKAASGAPRFADPLVAMTDTLHLLLIALLKSGIGASGCYAVGCVQGPYFCTTAPGCLVYQRAKYAPHLCSPRQHPKACTALYAHRSLDFTFKHKISRASCWLLPRTLQRTTGNDIGPRLPRVYAQPRLREVTP